MGISSVEFKIKDGLLVSQNVVVTNVTNDSSTLNQSFQYITFSYGNAVIPEIDTSEFSPL